MEALMAISVGTLGALLNVLISLDKKPDNQQYKQIFTFPNYWVVISLALGSGMASYFWFAPDHEAARTYLMFGASFPVIFERALRAFMAEQLPGAKTGC